MKTYRYKLLYVALTIGTLTAAYLQQGCAGTVQGDLVGRPDIFAETLRDLPEGPERDFLQQWYTVMKIVEPQNSAIFITVSQLDATQSAAKADSLIRFWWRQKDLEFRPDTPDSNEWLATMRERVDYCNSEYRQRDRYRYWSDMRAQAVILHGPPEQITTEEGKCWDRFYGWVAGHCTLYYLEWDKGTIRLGFEDKDGDDYTDEVVPVPEDVPLIGQGTDPQSIEKGYAYFRGMKDAKRGAISHVFYRGTGQKA